MRPSFQKLARAGVVAALIPFATCTDFTGPSGRGVQVPVIPTFSPAATFAKALYSAAGLEFDRVRVLILRNETVLKDTSVAFAPTSAELTLPLVIAASPGEVVTATLEYRTADMVLYAGSASVTTLAIGALSTSPTPIVLVPVGPGAAADKVEISPATGTFPISSPVTFTAKALAGTGAAIANAIFGWSVDDASIATVNAQGVVQPTTKGGTAHVRATTLNGKFAEAAVTFITAPASLAIASGASQSAAAFEGLGAPVVVKVLDQNGNAVAGAPVHFAVLAGGGTLTVLNEISDAGGLVSANWKLGGDVGTQSIKATADALPNAPLTITATATERSPASLAFAQQPTKSIMGAAITPAVTVKALDDKGRVVAGFTGEVTIAFDANPATATLGGTVKANAVAGVATFSTLSVSAGGTGYKLKATATGLASTTSEPFAVDQVPAGLSLFSGGSQTAVIRSTLEPVKVKVADANGVGVAGVTVGFQVLRGRGTLDVTSAVTDAAGIAKVIWTLGDSVGSQAIRAAVSGVAGSPLTVEAEGTPLPAIALAFVQGPSNVVVNGAMTPTVTVRAIDADGKIVGGFSGTIVLAFETNPTSATLGGTTSAPAVNGLASFPGLTVNVVATGYKLKATSGTLTPAVSGAFAVSHPAAIALSWVGGVSRDWSDANNWSPVLVPRSQDSVTIATATNQPLITSAATARAIVIEAGTSLEMNAPGLALTTTKILNRGTLRLTSALVTGDVENRATLLVDGIASVNAVLATNTATSRIVGTGVDGAGLIVLHSFVNEGQLQLTDVNGLFAELFVNDSLVNRTGATVSVLEGVGGERATSGVLRNYGTINVSSSRGMSMISTLSGSLNAGTITFTAGGNLTQAFPDSTITFVNTGTIALGTGRWDVANGNIKSRDGTVTGGGPFATFNTQLDIDFSRFARVLSIDDLTRFAGTTVAIPSGATVVLQNGNFAQKVEVSGTLRIPEVTFGPSRFLGGLTINTDAVVETMMDVRVDGPFDIQARGKLRLVSTAADRKFSVASGFTNQGSIEMTSAGLWVSTLEVESGALMNGTNGTISAQGGLGGERRISAVLDNAGAISVEGTSFMKLKGGVTHSNDGTITLLNAVGGGSPTAENLTSFALPTGSVLKNSGTINIGNFRAVYVEPGSTLDNQADRGVIAGTGKLRVPDGFANAGTIAPGGVGATGTLTLEGNLTTSSTSKIEIDVADTKNSGKYDKLVVTGSAFILGGVRVSTPPLFTVIDTYEVVTAVSSMVGDFSFSGPALWAGQADQTAKVVRVSNVIIGSPSPQ